MTDLNADRRATAPSWLDELIGSQVGDKARETRLALLLVSERLFSRHGVEAVSMRQIAQEAGHANNNVVQYHFETKERLVEALILWRVRSMEPRRAKMLADAEKAGRLDDMPTLLRIMCLPHLDITEGGVHPFARVLCDYMFRLRPAGMLHPSDRVVTETPVIRRVIRLVEDRLFFLPPALARIRSRTCVGMFLQNIIYADFAENSPDMPTDLAQVVEDTLSMMTHAIFAPPIGMAATVHGRNTKAKE